MEKESVQHLIQENIFNKIGPDLMSGFFISFSEFKLVYFY